MNIINAALSHALLTLRLKHDGKGLPKNIPAALAIAIVYCGLVALNASTIDFGTICSLIFIAQFYVFLLRNSIIGLMLLIGIIANALHLAITLIGLPLELISILSVFEYVMVYFGIINVLKANFQLT